MILIRGEGCVSRPDDIFGHPLRVCQEILPPKFLQLGTGVFINIFGILTGVTISITSVMLPRLLEGETGPVFAMKINTEEMSYIASAFMVGPYGMVITASLVDTLGHRRMMQIDATLLLAAVMTNALTTNTVVMCMARILIGISYCLETILDQ